MVYRRTNRLETDSVSDAVLDVWRRRKWLAISLFTAAMVATATLAISMPNLYRAATTVLVERQQVSEAFVRQSVTAELETRIQTIDQQVRSRARLTDVITRLNLYPELRNVVPMNALVEQMRRDIRLELKGVDQQTTGRTATIAFSLSYVGRDPETVAYVANTLVKFYIDEHTEGRERQAAKTAEFLRDQLAEIKRELDAQEERTSDFRLRHTTDLPQQLEANLAALERLNTQLRLNGEYQIRAIERHERLEKQLADARSGTPLAVGSSDPASAEIWKLHQQLAELRSQFSDRYPEVIRVKAEIAALERQRRPAPEGTNGHSAEVPADPISRLAASTLASERELKSLKDQERFLRQMIAGYEARVENAPKRQQELQELSRDYEATKERHDTMLKRYEDAQLAANLEEGHSVEQFKVLDPALPPLQPAAPNRPWFLLMGFAASIGLAVAAVFGAERLDTTFHTVDDLRAFVGVPTLATVQRIITAGDVRRARRRFALIAAVVLAGLFLIAAGTYYVAGGNEHLVRLTARSRG